MNRGEDVGHYLRKYPQDELGESYPWDMFGKELPRSKITFFTQVIMEHIVIIVCIVNLSIANGDSNL